MCTQQTNVHKPPPPLSPFLHLQVCKCSLVLMFECSEDVMVERLKRRGETSGRVDDNEETIRKRLHTFTESTLPVIQHYQTLGKVKLVSYV